MYCKACNKEIPDEAVFCPNCGMLVDDAELDETSILVEDDENETSLLTENNEEQMDLHDEKTIIDNSDIGNQSVNQVNNSADSVNPAYVNPAFQQTQMPNYNKNTYQPKQPQDASANIQPPNYSQQNQFNNTPPEVQYQTNQSNQSTNSQFQQSKITTYIDFYKAFAKKNTKKYVTTLGVICIITAVASLGLFGLYYNPLSILDFIFYGVFAGLTLKFKKWSLVLPVCIYGGVFTIIGFIATHTPSGIFALVISILAIVKLKKLDDAYKHYLMTNQFPHEKI